MSDASTTQSVECPICGDEFDPTVAGGWCTNTECGEWQYTEDSTEPETTAADDAEAEDAESDDGGFVSPAEDDDVDAEPVDLFDDSADADAEADAADDAFGAVEDDVEEGSADAEEADESADAEEADESADAEEADESADAEEADATEEVAEVDADAAAVEDTGEAAAVEAAAEAEPAGDDEDAAEAADTIDCPDCGVELDADANFCVDCGADVSGVTPGADELDACPGCGTDVEPADNFCVNCGEDLAAHREGDAGEPDDAIDAPEASDDEAGVTESLVLTVEGREIHVDDGDTVGREIRAALTEAGRPDEEAVRIHREHVRFVREDDSFYLLDLGDNPTQLNGRTLKKGDREPVAPGDELELSGVASVSVQAP
ncbi:double zinc ribbon domain-containing protein [Haloarcula onubensis]|uniref:Zinc ribbon domain-containing protein n=1 Tax=Haloarcula onubensis TaxID=2950539 RepID=A0ABU2FQ08_9EURY|nr:zinc ribbon domain-containing protein [Halomicroarcula sp. S3CR25-11]MDS0282845.1 zinc ribbon domain-containing protein [Halomicroarcula sp. S3CR25-11]